MTDQSYIRKAVELADGWEITWEKMLPSDFTHVTMPAGVTFYLEDRAKPQWALDALAAQLVRQVDARGYSYGVEEYPDHTAVVRWENGRGTPVGYAEGEERHWNTIKAIVDSEVLTKTDN